MLEDRGQEMQDEDEEAIYSAVLGSGAYQNPEKGFYNRNKEQKEKGDYKKETRDRKDRNTKEDRYQETKDRTRNDSKNGTNPDKNDRNKTKPEKYSPKENSNERQKKTIQITEEFVKESYQTQIKRDPQPKEDVQIELPKPVIETLQIQEIKETKPEPLETKKKSLRLINDKNSAKLKTDSNEFKSSKQSNDSKDCSVTSDKKEKKSVKILKINSDSYHADPLIGKPPDSAELKSPTPVVHQPEEQEDFKEFKIRKLDQEAQNLTFKEKLNGTFFNLSDQKPVWNQRKKDASEPNSASLKSSQSLLGKIPEVEKKLQLKPESQTNISSINSYPYHPQTKLGYNKTFTPGMYQNG